MNNQIKRVAVVGAGAVGSYYGARLASAGVDVTFLLRSDYEHVSQFGMRITSVAGDFDLPEISCQRSAEEIGPVDLVIIAWKTTANHSYQEVISPLIADRTIILTLQNGLGSTDELARLFGEVRIYGGLCFVCINRLGAGRINHSASGLIRVGKHLSDQRKLNSAEGSELNQLVELLRFGSIHAEAVDSLERAQWMKLIWNIPFNGLAIAEGGVDTQALLAIDGMEARIRKIMHEVQTVAAALGHEIEDEYINHQIKITKPMLAYRPSSMIDFVEGREVEVDSIWREPLRRAQSVGVPVPEIESLLEEIEVRINQR